LLSGPDTKYLHTQPSMIKSILIINNQINNEINIL
jgi:hypothetical protein